MNDLYQPLYDQFDLKDRQVLNAHTHASPPVPGLYLKVFHGRHAPDEQLEDWGFDGPIFGPLKYCHITYLTTIGVCFADTDEELGPCCKWLFFSSDLLVHIDEKDVTSYYGDFSIFTVTEEEVEKCR